MGAVSPTAGVLRAGVVNLNGNGHYLHWGAVQISYANLIVILLMVVAFVAAVLIPFKLPGHRAKPSAGPGPKAGTPPTPLAGDEGQWSAKVRRAAVGALPPDKVLPDRQPSYVASWIYVFGSLTIASFAIVILTGFVLALFGPAWWHHSSAGHFFNSLHLWSVEAFFFFMVVHLWAKYFMAAWRGKRRLTWVTGVVTFVVSIAAAFTGYLSQQNFDSEWISTQAKDGINSTGAGAWWNVLNFGQMLMWHIVLLPLAVLVLVGVHVLLVRHRGVVPPFDLQGRGEGIVPHDHGQPTGLQADGSGSIGGSATDATPVPVPTAIGGDEPATALDQTGARS